VFENIIEDQPCTAKDVRLVKGTEVGREGLKKVDHWGWVASVVPYGKIFNQIRRDFCRPTLLNFFRF
jgi:hypothetical protein